jgi:hypothetical protein
MVGLILYAAVMQEISRRRMVDCMVIAYDNKRIDVPTWLITVGYINILFFASA